MGEEAAKTEQQPKDDSAQLSPKEAIAAKPNFADRITELKTSAQAHLQKVNQLFDPEIPQSKSEPQKPTTPEEVLRQLEALDKEESLSPSEFLSRSKQILRASADIKNLALAQREKLEQQTHSLQADLVINIDPRIETLNRMRGIKKILARREGSHLATQKSDMQSQLSELEKQMQSQEQLMDQIREQEYSVGQKQEKADETLMIVVGQEMAAIRNGYEQLLQEILQDGTMTADIRETYIEQIIVPQVDEDGEERQKTKDEEGKFYQALRTYIDHGEEPDVRISDHKKLLDSLGYADIPYLADPLLDGADKKIIKSLVVKMAMPYIAPILTAAESRWKDHVPNNKFWKIFQETLGPLASSSNIKDSFGQQVVAEFNKFKPFDLHDDIVLWQGVKYSRKANELFGEEIQKQDQKYYSALLEESLNGGSSQQERRDAIHDLRYYPTPDAMKILVLSASAYPSEYVTQSANHALFDLSNRKDWQDILDNAIKAYPSLKTARFVLEKSSSTPTMELPFQYRRPEIQDAVQDFTLSILQDGRSPKGLVDLALKTISNSSLLDFLHQKGVIADIETVSSLKGAGTLLDELVKRKEEAIKNGKKTDWLGINGDALKDAIKEKLINVMNAKQDRIELQLSSLKRLTYLCQKIIENQSDYNALRFLSSGSLVDKLQDQGLNDRDVPTLLNAYVDCPSLIPTGYVMNMDLLRKFCEQFSGKETVQFFNDITTAYGDRDQQLLRVLNLVQDNHLTKERAVELPTKAGDLSSQLFDLALNFPSIYLATDPDVEFLRKMATAYGDIPQEILSGISSVISYGRLSREMALAFPQEAPALMQDKMKETRTFIWEHGNTILKDTSDLKFLNRMVGEFGQKADTLIRGYQECLTAGVITIDEKELVLEFARQFKVIAPATLAGYKEAKQASQEKIYIAQLRALAERMTSSGTTTEDDKNKPYYKDLLRHVYANNAGKWSSFESNDSCNDRATDLTEFKIKPRYEIDLLSNSEIRIKAGETLNRSVQDEVQQPILGVAERVNVLGHDKEKIMSSLQENIDKTLEEIVQKGGLQGIDPNALTSTEEKMFLVLTDSIYGTRSINPKQVKDLVIAYEFAVFEDISDYIAGTRDRVGRASNQDYALLCEVLSFYSDRIKEVNRRLVTAAYNNPQIAALMPEYFKQLAQDSNRTQRQDKISKLQIDKLGTSESFVKQLTRILEKRRGRKYSSEEVGEIIKRYESSTGGLQEKTSTSKNPQTRAFYGQLRSQREKTFEALQIIAGEKVDPKTVHLGEISLQQALETETGIKEGKYDGEQFASYTVQRFIDLFDNERTKINAELAKFESMSGTQREVLHGYITKSKESANARMVGGVCVAGDNPIKSKDKNMWDMPNYLQLVFQEPDTLQCQGLVLLHHFTQDGKRILTASINPSSTYLYSVDEGALFNGIMGTLGQFAQDNNFDMITVSQNKTVRTNRTGGQFEKSLDAKVTSVGKKFRFNSPQTFSYNPNYKIQEMDVVWEKT